MGARYSWKDVRLGCDPQSLTFRERRIFVEHGGSDEASMSWVEAAARWFGANGPLVGTGCYQPPPGLGGKYKGGPVGIEAIAATLQEETDTLVDVVEPYLLKIGFIMRTSSGRKTSESAYEHLCYLVQKGLF